MRTIRESDCVVRMMIKKEAALVMNLVNGIATENDESDEEIEEMNDEAIEEMIIAGMTEEIEGMTEGVIAEMIEEMTAETTEEMTAEAIQEIVIDIIETTDEMINETEENDTDANNHIKYHIPINSLYFLRIV